MLKILVLNLNSELDVNALPGADMNDPIVDLKLGLIEIQKGPVLYSHPPQRVLR